MNPFEMVVAIIIVITIGKVLQSRYRYRGDAPRPDPAEAMENRQLRQDIQALRERVQVLERVAGRVSGVIPSLERSHDDRVVQVGK